MRIVCNVTNRRSRLMTSKERQRMQRLEAENRMLREEIAKHMRIYSNTLCELVEAKSKIELVKSAMEGE